MTPADLVRIMFRASQSDVGLLLRVSDARRAVDAFARAREEAASGEAPVELPPVSFRILDGHPEGNLVILRSGVSLAPPASADALGADE